VERTADGVHELQERRWHDRARGQAGSWTPSAATSMHWLFGDRLPHPAGEGSDHRAPGQHRVCRIESAEPAKPRVSALREVYFYLDRPPATARSKIKEYLRYILSREARMRPTRREVICR